MAYSLPKDPGLRPQNAGELLQMAYGCRCSDGWNQEQAEHWWKAHLPHLSGALDVSTRREPSHLVSG